MTVDGKTYVFNMTCEFIAIYATGRHKRIASLPFPTKLYHQNLHISNRSNYYDLTTQIWTKTARFINLIFDKKNDHPWLGIKSKDEEMFQSSNQKYIYRVFCKKKQDCHIWGGGGRVIFLD